MVDVQGLLEQALTLHRANQLAQAQEGYQAVLAQDPDNADALHLLGLIARSEGDGERAVALLEKVVRLRPNFPDAVYNLANVYQGCRRYAEAEATYRQAIALRPVFDWAHLNLGNVLYKSGRFAEAMQECETAREQRLLDQARARMEQAAARPFRPATPARNLILGFAMGYEYSHLAPFIRSARDAGIDADMVLFVSEASPETIAALAADGVQVEPGDGFRHIPFHMAHARFFLFETFLSRFEAPWPDAGRYQNVFLADVRDVVFQSDVFAALAPGAPLAAARFVGFLESEAVTIGACDANGAWVRNLFPPAVAAELADKPISCVGTLLGRFDGVLEYLRQMQILSYALRPEVRQMHGIDQGIHNLILHRGIVAGSCASRNGVLVGTVGYGLPQGVHIRNAAVCRPDGQPIPVLHQYDRHPEYNALFASRYGQAARNR